MSEKNLIAELRSGNPDAYDEIFLRHSTRVYGYALKTLNSEADAEDIVQEVFFALWKYKHNIDASKNFDSYLFVMTVNAIRKRLREKYNEQAAYERLQEIHPSTANKVMQEQEFRNLREIILKAIEQLPPRQKEIYYLSREKAYRNAEIAERFNISKKTVENQLNRALKFLKDYLTSNDMLLL